MKARHAMGFTLIEVLLATMLLAAGLALAFATLRSAGAISQRGEDMAARSERMRTVEGFLRQRLASALPVAMGRDERTLRPLRFIGEPRRMRFVADVPDYLGLGGPYLHDIQADASGPARQLRIALTQVLAGEPVADASRKPEVLAEGLVEARFAYRGIDPRQGTPGDWQDEWTESERLPRWVRIELRDARGPWPALLVVVPLSTPGRAQL